MNLFGYLFTTNAKSFLDEDRVKMIIAEVICGMFELCTCFLFDKVIFFLSVGELGLCFGNATCNGTNLEVPMVLMVELRRGVPFN